MEETISTSATGARSELLAAADLLRRGYHVLRAVSPTGPFDLAAFKDGRFYRVEVKTAPLTSVGTPYRMKLDTSRFDMLVLVTKSDDVYYETPDEHPIDDLPFRPVHDFYAWAKLETTL